MNPDIDILQLISHLAQEQSFATGLFVYVDDQSLPTAESFVTTLAQQATWHAHSLVQLQTLPFTARTDLAIVDIAHIRHRPEINTPDIDLARGLTRLRDLFARRVLVIVRQQLSTDYTQMLRALGFSQLVLPDQLHREVLHADAGDQFWQFNILSYKQTPDWLNAKYWANPENWGKYRW